MCDLVGVGAFLIEGAVLLKSDVDLNIFLPLSTEHSAKKLQSIMC